SSQHGFNVVRAADPLGPFEVINSAPITGTEVSFFYLDRSGLTAGGQFYYDLEVIDVSGSTSRNGAVNVQVSAVTTSELFQNAPNPFNPTTLIRFALPQPTRVSIHIFNMIGQEVAVLLDNIQKPAGFDVVTWDGTNATGRKVSSGVYLYRITTAAGFDQTKRMVLLR
ncbi:MAG: T9SS type A sorting domain-containing protein, partial [Candidatus Latescibacteria bacterium]|nr:T9SS type A sorting domain-containing protein [Candidatus Latescibacterota bacterium]